MVTHSPCVHSLLCATRSFRSRLMMTRPTCPVSGFMSGHRSTLVAGSSKVSVRETGGWRPALHVLKKRKSLGRIRFSALKGPFLSKSNHQRVAEAATCVRKGIIYIYQTQDICHMLYMQPISQQQHPLLHCRSGCTRASNTVFR